MCWASGFRNVRHWCQVSVHTWCHAMVVGRTCHDVPSPDLSARHRDASLALLGRDWNDGTIYMVMRAAGRPAVDCSRSRRPSSQGVAQYSASCVRARVHGGGALSAVVLARPEGFNDHKLTDALDRQGRHRSSRASHSHPCPAKPAVTDM